MPPSNPPPTVPPLPGSLVLVASSPFQSHVYPLTEAELEELLNIAMGERGGGTGGNPPGPLGGSGPPGGGGPMAAGGAAAQPVATATNVKAMGRDPPLFQGHRSKADTFMNEVKKYLTLCHRRDFRLEKLSRLYCLP